MWWLLLLLLHVSGLAGYNLLLRRSLVANVDRWTLATIMQTGIALPMVVAMVVHPVSFGSYDGRSAAYLLATLVLVVALHTTNVKSLQYLEASVYSVFYNLRIIITTILGVLFLGEAVVPLQILGGLLILLAVVMVRQKGKASLTRRGIQWGIAAAVVISFLNMFEKLLIADVGYLEYAVPVMVGAAVLMWTVLVLRRERVDLRIFYSPAMLLLMFFRAVSAYAFTIAFSLGATLSVASYISSLSVIVIVVLGVVLLQERDYLQQKVVATLLAVAGLTVILAAQLH